MATSVEGKNSSGNDASKENKKPGTTEDVGRDVYDEMDEMDLDEDVPLSSKQKKNLAAEEDNSDEEVNRETEVASRGVVFRKTLRSSWRKVLRIVNAILVQDDDPLYGRGTLGVFSGVYLSYMQNILLLHIMFIRLPWIVGILSLSLTSLSIFIVFATVFFSSFSVVAIATNGSDRLYGGPFTTIAYSLGNRVAFVAVFMLCAANCSFAGFSLTTCTQLIERYALRQEPLTVNLTERAFQNDPEAIHEVRKTPYYMHLILFFALLTLVTFFNAFGKCFIKCVCWIPFTIFVILLVGIFVATGTKKSQKDIELRCIFEPPGLRPKERYHDQLPVMLYLPPNYTVISPIYAWPVPSVMKHYCKYPFDANCTMTSVEGCVARSFRLEAIEWNFKIVRSNLHNHITEISNIHSFDWRSIVYDIDFFGSVFFSADTKFASISGCALLLLPLFTGSVCGINIPSVLKSPTKNIPPGIFSSLMTMLAMVTFLTFSLALGVERHLLIDKYGFGAYPSLPVLFTVPYPSVVITGLLLMSTVAATQSMYTAKSLLLSILTSHMIPVPRFFYRRTSKRRAILAVVLTAILIVPFLLVNSVDYICVVASCCMLVALIVINLGTILCSMLNFPSFRPAFPLFRSFLALFGIIGSATMIYGCKPQVGLVVSAAAVLVYVIFPLYRLRFRSGTRHDMIVDIANTLLYSCQRSNARHPGEFSSKPRCIVFTRFPASCDNLLRMAKILSQNRSALCLSLIRDTGDQENIGLEDVRTARQCMDYIELSGYATQFKYQKISSLHSIASALASCCGLGVFQSNTVMIAYPSLAALEGVPDSLLYHYHMHRVCVQHCNLVVVKGTFSLKIKPVQSNQTIDIWWIIDNGDVLLMAAKMLKQHKIWHKAKLRLFLVVDIEDDIKDIEKALLMWLVDNHYLLHKIEIIRADSWIIHEYTQLRALQIKQRYSSTNNKSCTTYLQRLIDVPDGTPAQNAVDRGFRVVPTTSTQTNPITKTQEQMQRAQQLNKEILERSSDAVLVLMNMPEPPVHLERFWKYLNFLNDMSSGLNKVLFVRGVDVQPNVEVEATQTEPAQTLHD